MAPSATSLADFSLQIAELEQALRLTLLPGLYGPTTEHTQKLLLVGERFKQRQPALYREAYELREAGELPCKEHSLLTRGSISRS